ncbi:LOW QUALITY PROTEIN: hypothetical protein V1478_011244, partial [Vespula squamosa]
MNMGGSGYNVRRSLIPGLHRLLPYHIAPPPPGSISTSCTTTSVHPFRGKWRHLVRSCTPII